MTTRKAAAHDDDTTDETHDETAAEQQPAVDQPEPAKGPTLPTFVIIRAYAPVTVVTEQIVDRERRPNGSTPLAAGEEQSFIIHGGQSIRVIEGGAA
jgi:hypothetical protein